METKKYRLYSNAVKNRKAGEITIMEEGYYKNIEIKGRHKRRKKSWWW